MTSIASSSATSVGTQSSIPEANSNPQYVIVDPCFLCFDVEQQGDARQRVTLTQTGVGKQVAWRIRTNAPTRYIVCPNGGVLDENNPIQNVSIELVDNRFNPQHKLIVSAISLLPHEIPKGIWKTKRAKEHENVQTVVLDLSTTLISLEKSIAMSIASETDVVNVASLNSMLEQSSTTGRNRIKELESIIRMLESDIAKINAQISKIKETKVIVSKHIASRKERKKDLTPKVRAATEKAHQLSVLIHAQEAEITDIKVKSKTPADPNCSVM